jgi:hypothetical protein
MRPFGSAEDLDIEFEGSNRPELVTALLDHCAHADDPAFWWAQPVGARTEAMLRLLALTEGTDRLGVQLNCARTDCGEGFGVELPVERLRSPDTKPMQIDLPGGRVVQMRRPTGNDLRHWHAGHYADRADAHAELISALRIDGAITPEDEPALVEAIAERDPLVAFSVSCTCPACGAQHDVPIDLEGAVLHRLAARQRSLFREVHLLASCYGWTEREALAVPPHRRARYLALIEDAV